MGARKTITGCCGCEISAAKNQIGKTVNTCSKCGGKCCNKHYYFHVDGNNIAITKSHYKNGVCSKCCGEEPFDKLRMAEGRIGKPTNS